MLTLQYEGIALHLALTELHTVPNWHTMFACRQMHFILAHLFTYRAHLEQLMIWLTKTIVTEEEEHISLLLHRIQWMKTQSEQASHLYYDQVRKRKEYGTFVKAFFECMDTFQACLNESNECLGHHFA